MNIKSHGHAAPRLPSSLSIFRCLPPSITIIMLPPSSRCHYHFTPFRYRHALFRLCRLFTITARISTVRDIACSAIAAISSATSSFIGIRHARMPRFAAAADSRRTPRRRRRQHAAAAEIPADSIFNRTMFRDTNIEMSASRPERRRRAPARHERRHTILIVARQLFTTAPHDDDYAHTGRQPLILRYAKIFAEIRLLRQGGAAQRQRATLKDGALLPFIAADFAPAQDARVGRLPNAAACCALLPTMPRRCCRRRAAGRCCRKIARARHAASTRRRVGAPPPPRHFRLPLANILPLRWPARDKCCRRRLTRS